MSRTQNDRLELVIDGCDRWEIVFNVEGLCAMGAKTSLGEDDDQSEIVVIDPVGHRILTGTSYCPDDIGTAIVHAIEISRDTSGRADAVKAGR